ncbi:type II secretion system F family protein [Vibrio tubiashii]|uniref:type II secretion system F family protein n=1 Tax=Vibrio tubiashii TaxID=29498 RepID=UPI001EFD10A6|nr:type II secretion system F family protein [Vibrio tubiashii]MCG9578613.1 type II secretion system F family protein [Vibrio tubiashii]
MIDKFNEAKFRFHQVRAFVANQTPRALVIAIVEIVMCYLLRTLLRGYVNDYIKFVIGLTSTTETAQDGTVTQTGEGAAFAEVTYQLNIKLKEGYPKRTQRPIQKFLYKIIYERSTSTNPTILYTFQPFLTSSEIMVLTASSDPISGLRIIAEQGNARKAIIKKVKKILVLPAVYIALIFVLAHLLQGSMVSMLMGIVARTGASPTAELERINAINLFLINNQYLLILLMCLGFFVFSWLNQNLSGKPRSFAEKLPVIGSPLKQSRIIQSGVFLQSIALLYTSGINTKRALSLISENSNPFVKSKLKQMIEVHRLTGSDIEAFRNDLFDIDVQFQLSVYFELADPSTNMNAIAKNILISIEEKIERFTTLINVLCTALLASYIITFIFVYTSIDQLIPKA